MASLERCPRCNDERLAVLYYDGEGNPVGGYVECPECGPRHAVDIPAEKPVRQKLLEKKAS